MNDNNSERKSNIFSKIANRSKTILTIASIAALIGTVMTFAFSAHDWYENVNDTMKDNDLLKAKVSNLEDKMSGRDTVTPFVTKFKFYQLVERENNDYNSIYLYKYPYGKWGVDGQN